MQNLAFSYRILGLWTSFHHFSDLFSILYWSKVQMSVKNGFSGEIIHFEYSFGHRKPESGLGGTHVGKINRFFRSK